jgi:hypothetical protein
MEKRSSGRWPIVLQIFLAVVLCGGAIAGIIYYSFINPPSGMHNVTFRVEASGGYASITLDAGKEKISKPTTVTVPWERTVEIQRGVQVYLTASNPTQTGQLKCAILLDRLPWKSGTTTAPKDGVACAGIVP